MIKQLIKLLSATTVLTLLIGCGQQVKDNQFMMVPTEQLEDNVWHVTMNSWYTQEMDYMYNSGGMPLISSTYTTYSGDSTTPWQVVDIPENANFLLLPWPAERLHHNHLAISSWSDGIHDRVGYGQIDQVDDEQVAIYKLEYKNGTYDIDYYRYFANTGSNTDRCDLHLSDDTSTIHDLNILADNLFSDANIHVTYGRRKVEITADHDIHATITYDTKAGFSTKTEEVTLGREPLVLRSR